MTLPTVTVVMPAFNAEAWIAESLSSVAAQTYAKELIDIVVVDDGSTDGTIAAAERVLQGSGIACTILSNTSPAGPSAARNRGWRTGRGRWVQFLDADDRIAPSKIAAQAAVAATAPLHVAAFHSRWAKLVLQDGQWVDAVPAVEPETGDDPLVDLLRADNFMQLGCLLFSRKWLERVNGFDESIRLIEDVQLLLRLMMGGAALQRVRSAQPLSWYRQHPTSLSRSDDRGFVEGCVRNARMVERHWRELGNLRSTRANALAAVYFMAARFFSGRDSEAFDALVADIYRLKPDFVPDGPRALRLLTRLVGYPRAERCAVQYRRLKRTITPQASP
jgi:glycosyltransferase involved in cell wall biosynthesis